jgi:NAD(P)-dependent dehydrogenase (short-subunit alcohol dehydrogenase family)
MDYKHTGSRIINLVSVAGLCPMEAGSAYASSKHAAIGFTDSLRAELRPFHIQVSTVNPAFHSTPILDHAMELGPDLLKSLPLETREKYGEGNLYNSFFLLHCSVISLLNGSLRFFQSILSKN